MNGDTDAQLTVKLTEKGIRIKNLIKLIIEALCNANIDDNFIKLLSEYIVLKKEAKKLLAVSPTIQISNRDAQEIIRKISHGESLEIDKYIDSIWAELNQEFDWEEFDWNEIEALAEKHFLTWLNHLTFTQEFISISSLILGVNIPDILKQFVKEVKYCYAFEQYLAVYALCRTILETSIRDMCIRKGIIKRNKDNIIDYSKYRIYEDMIYKVSSGKLKEKIIDIYKDTSFLIHGHKIIDSTKAREMFKMTIKTVESLYKTHGY